MKHNDLETRERIMKCTLALVRNERDFSSITVRRIASDAGVNLSAVNYHFGSKEKLINEVIRKPIIEYLASKGNVYEQYKNDAVKRLKELVKLPAAYLAENPNISSISILSDMTNPLENDLTAQTEAFLMPAFREAFPQMDEAAAGRELWTLISLVQTAFLRSANFFKLTGIDYFSESDRNMFLEKYIDALVEKKEVM